MAQQNNQTSQNDNRDSGDVGQLSFERAIDELESIVKRLEEGKVPLEESVAIYERGGTTWRIPMFPSKSDF